MSRFGRHSVPVLRNKMPSAGNFKKEFLQKDGLGCDEPSPPRQDKAHQHGQNKGPPLLPLFGKVYRNLTDKVLSD